MGKSNLRQTQFSQIGRQANACREQDKILLPCPLDSRV
jgi:hypothetical protein